MSLPVVSSRPPVAIHIELIMPHRRMICRLVEVFENPKLRFKIGYFAGMMPQDLLPLSAICSDTWLWGALLPFDLTLPVQEAGMYLDDDLEERSAS